jgi:hypothetical protein
MNIIFLSVQGSLVMRAFVLDLVELASLGVFIGFIALVAP